MDLKIHAMTGQVLAGLSMPYPFWGEHVSIIPDFEQKVLEGSLYIKGRIRIIHFVRLMWNPVMVQRSA